MKKTITVVFLLISLLTCSSSLAGEILLDGWTNGTLAELQDARATLQQAVESYMFEEPVYSDDATPILNPNWYEKNDIELVDAINTLNKEIEKRGGDVIVPNTIKITPNPTPDATPRPTAIPLPTSLPIETYHEALDIHDLKLYHSGDYAYIEGTVKNTGRKTYEFIKVRAQCKNVNKEVIDIDWTYLVGSEGIRPNESKAFLMMVRDTSNKIKSVSVEVTE